MIEILLALTVLVALAIWGSQQEFSIFSDFICPVFAVLGFFALLIYAFVAFDYVAAEYKANIINAEYGTNYTQADVFYASSVIETIRQLDRKRIELNGDLITGK